MAEDYEYDIGYGKPPKASQFPKGQSGNSRGRPKQEASITAVFRKISKQKVRTNGKDGPQCMTKLEASITQLMNKAATGDLKALKVLLQTTSRLPELAKDPDPMPTIVISPVWSGAKAPKT
jgi:hypothetical protein